MISFRRVVALLIAPVLLLPLPARAQIRASELGSVSQVIDGTKLTITGSRPRARERNPIFGTRIAHWGEVWTPGANWATTLEVDRDVTINQRPVPKGKYSVWMVLRENGDWTTVLDPDFRRFHTEPPDSTVKQIRFPVKVGQAPFMDVLTWSVPELTISGGTIAMQWGTTQATMQLAVQPTLKFTLAEDEARPYLGAWEYLERGPGNTTKSRILTLSHEDGTLKGRFDPNVEWMGTFAMIRVAPDVFVPGLYDRHGQIYDVLRPDIVFTFTRVGGRPETFEERYEDDTLGGTGKRKS
jgi:hypothetical protein